MCLKIKSGPHIASRNMTVLKILSFENYSAIRAFHYQPNKLYPSISLQPSGGYLYHGGPAEGWSVHVGYHAYDISQIDSYRIDDVGDVELLFTGYDDARWGLIRGGSVKRKMVLFTIPKGAIYYIGEDADIVSSEIRSGSLKCIRARDLKRYNPKISRLRG